MSLRLIVIVSVLLLAGCGETTPTPQATTSPAPTQSGVKNSKLPPEVEFDPATATQKYQKKKTKP